MTNQNHSQPHDGRYRHHAVTFRMTNAEKELFEKAFSASGFDSKQNYIISTVCEKDMVPDRYIYLYFKILTFLEDLYRQLKGIGINVNQMAYKLNSKGIPPALIELEATNTALKGDVSYLWESIRYNLRELQRTQR